jgi:hypothetical protein
MLSEHPIDVMILATDLGVAREFYGDRIGLEVLIESQDFLTFTCGGDSRLVVTRSATGTSEPQTKAFWRVNDLAAEVVELRSRGINVEEYDEPGLKTVDLDPARQAGARGLLRAVPHRDHRRGEHVSQSHGSRGLPAREPRRRRVPDRLPVRHRPAPARLARLRRARRLAAKDTGPTGRAGSTARPWRRSGATARGWPSPTTSAARGRGGRRCRGAARPAARTIETLRGDRASTVSLAEHRSPYVQMTPNRTSWSCLLTRRRISASP